MSYFPVLNRLKLARQREREKYEAIKAASDRNSAKIERLESAFSEFVAENKSQIQAAGRQASATDQSEREHQANELSMRRSTGTIARFTIVLGLVGIAGAIISGLTLFAIQGQLAEMKADRRPWVAFDETVTISKPLTFDQSGAHISFAGTIRNGGKSIAKNIQSVKSQLIVEPAIPENVMIPPSQMGGILMRGLPGSDPCGRNIAQRFTSWGGDFLLPGGIERWQPSNGREDVPISAIKTESSGRVSVLLDICIFYKDDA